MSCYTHKMAIVSRFCDVTAPYVYAFYVFFQNSKNVTFYIFWKRSVKKSKKVVGKSLVLNHLK